MKYELLYVLPAEYTEAELPAVKEKVVAALSGINAAVTRHDPVGRLKIAYAIKKNHFGYYFLAEFDAEPGQVTLLNTALNLAPEVIRFQINKREPGALPRQHLLSFEDATLRARALRETLRAAAPAAMTAPAARPAPAAAAVTARVQLSEEEIEKKIDKLLSENEPAIT